MKQTGQLEEMGVGGRTKEAGWVTRPVDSSGPRHTAVAGFQEQSQKHFSSIKMLVSLFGLLSSIGFSRRLFFHLVCLLVG
jgi:hypothetical protein